MKLSLVTARVLRTNNSGKEKEKNEHYLIQHKNSETPESIAMSMVDGLVDPENITSTKLLKGVSVIPDAVGDYFYYICGELRGVKSGDDEEEDEKEKNLEFKKFVRANSFKDAYQFITDYLSSDKVGITFEDYEISLISKKNIVDMFK